MNAFYIETKVDSSWGKKTDISAIEKLLLENKIHITPDKVERMPESYISDGDNGSIQTGKK